MIIHLQWNASIKSVWGGGGNPYAGFLYMVASMAMGNRSNLRKQPKGYSGLDGARKLLNDMIYEGMTKYDQEIAKCTDYYSRQCAAMEACRGQIAAWIDQHLRGWEGESHGVNKIRYRLV